MKERRSEGCKVFPQVGADTEAKRGCFPFSCRDVVRSLSVFSHRTHHIDVGVLCLGLETVNHNLCFNVCCHMALLRHLSAYIKKAN